MLFIASSEAPRLKIDASIRAKLQQEDIMKNSRQRLKKFVDSLYLSGDPENDFIYLGGPMAGQQYFNYPAFDKAAQILRNNGYNVMSANEIFGPEVREECLGCETGDYDEIAGEWKSFMEDTLTLLCMPACVQAVFLPGWQASSGCNIEIELLLKLSKPVYELGINTELDCPSLVWIDSARDDKQWVSSPGAVEIAADYTNSVFEISDPLSDLEVLR